MAVVIAAVVAVAVVAIAVVAVASGDSDQPRGSGGGKVAVVDGGNLGPVNDGAALALIVGRRLGVSVHAGPDPSDPPAPGATSGATSPAAGGQPAEAQRSSDAVKDCSRAAAASGASAFGALDFRATVLWETRPAQVLGYVRAGSTLTHHLFVMSQPDCSLLAVQSF